MDDKKTAKLNDEELDKVSGGYTVFEKYLFWFRCPVWGWTSQPHTAEPADAGSAAWQHVTLKPHCTNDSVFEMEALDTETKRKLSYEELKLMFPCI